jgi:hypothetical protein
MSDPASIQAKIDELEAEMARTQKNKATNYHLGELSKSPNRPIFCDLCIHILRMVPGQRPFKLTSFVLDINFLYFCRNTKGKNCQAQVGTYQWSWWEKLRDQKCRARV